MHFILANKEYPLNINKINNDYENYKILIKEFKSFKINYDILINKLGRLDNSLSLPFNFNVAFSKTFKKQADFLTACTMLRPFILVNEKYYSKANNIIRNTLNIKNNILLKQSMDEILPKELKSIKIQFPAQINYSNQKIKNFCDSVNKESSLYNFVQKNRIDEKTISITNYPFFDIYLNSYIFHRDQEFQYFIEEIIGIKDFNLPTQKDPTNFIVINYLYHVVLQLLKKVHLLYEIIFHIDSHIHNKKNFKIEYFTNDSANFPNLLIKGS